MPAAMAYLQLCVLFPAPAYLQSFVNKLMLEMTIAILVAYAVLFFISVFLDPKKKAIQSDKKYSIYQMLLFSTIKMLIAVAIVITVALSIRVSLIKVVGLSGSSLNWQVLCQGLIAASGFVFIYIVWQLLSTRFSSKVTKTDSTEKSMIALLPKCWLPLIGTFAIISFEAGLLEEIFFRGIMQSHILSYVAPLWAVIIAGLFFGFAHFYQGASGVIGTSILGIWLGATFVITGNIAVPIIGHFLGDFTCMMLSGKQIIQRSKNR